MVKLSRRTRQFVEALQRGRRFIAHDVWRIGMPGEEIPHGSIIRHIRVAILLVQGVIRDDLLLRASSLTFATMLAVVPFLAIMFFMIQTFHIGETISQLFMLLFGIDPSLTPEDQKHKLIALLFQGFEKGVSAPPAVGLENPVGMIVTFAERNANPGTLTAATLIFLLSIVFGLMMNIEGSFNTIWGIRRTRSWYRIFSDYMMILLVLPFLVGGVLCITVILENPLMVEHLGPFAVGIRGIPYLAASVAFTALYYFVPNTRVRFRYAIFAGVVAGVLWCLLSVAYVKYQFGLKNYSLLYSTFAQLPVLLMWIYCSWLVLLFGAELAFAYQNEPTFAMERWAEGTSYAYREALGLWTMLELGRRFDAGLPGLSAEVAAKEWNVPTRLLNDTLINLEDARLAVRCASHPPTYQPSRSLDKITVQDVVDCLREAGREPSPLRNNPVFRSLTHHLDACTKPNGSCTIADCLRMLGPVRVLAPQKQA